ncbi:EAL domain-containing protein [Phenylobacterium sp.]|uniref:putative bifunctional diguanylate cyclase/phosphodiesterase n=1 Tax=Phenylobacterium sp. TaxID=1871053 RepID=UPI00286C6A3E|nr:EAL domain-containing protein [Phenylobacterium sp.]
MTAPTFLSRRLRGLPPLWAPGAVIALLVAIASFGGVLAPIDDGLATLRFDMVRRAPSQTLTVVEIDAASLRAAGRWPWGRDRFARAIENLQAAGAKTVAFDVDFSTVSSPDADQRLKAAVNRQPGAVVLPTFIQRGANEAEAGFIETAPLASLAADALVASVNVPVDRDGRVRRYSRGVASGEIYRPSMGSVLADAPFGATGMFLIDYGVRHDRIDHLSFNDVYEGRFDPNLVRGRTVLIGATALEIGDEFATPRAGTLPGVYIHALARESLLAARALHEFAPWLTFALGCLVILALVPNAKDPSLRKALRRQAAVLIVVVAAPVALQVAAPVSPSVAPLLLAQLMCLVWLVNVELQRRAAAIVREREAGLLHLAMHEPETGLPNRRALTAEIDTRLSGDAAPQMAVMAIGIDQYVATRSAIGYSHANQLVRLVAERAATQAGGVTVAHLSTSVLGLALTAETPEQLRAAVAAVAAIDHSFDVDSHVIDAFIRVGIAVRSHGEDARQLLEQATIALDGARARSARQVVFDRETFADPSANLALMSEMMAGLQAGDLLLYYQPKVEPGSGQVVGMEALVRWRHPVRGFIPPDAFIPTAEDTGAVRPLTEWVLRRALEDNERLRAAGFDLVMAVNISARLLADRDFREFAVGLVGDAAQGMCFEITESAVMDNTDEAMAAIAAYRAAGIKISIDDYGTGLSSLAYLKMIDADELKIDKALVTGLMSNRRDRLILKSTIDLAHSLGLSVVAEGVEDADVQGVLATMRCDVVQGYGVSRPIAYDQLLTFLQDAKPRRRPRKTA